MEVSLFVELENRIGFIEEVKEEKTEGFIKSFIFLDENNKKINVLKKIEKCKKYNKEFFINTFDNGMISSFVVIDKNKETKYLAISKNILKRVSKSIDILEEMDFKKDLIDNLRKEQMLDMCKIIYHSKKYKQNEGTEKDNSIVVCDYLSFLLRFNYDSGVKNGK